MADETPAAESYHLNDRQSVVAIPGCRRITQIIEGPYDAVKTAFDAKKVGVVESHTTGTGTDATTTYYWIAATAFERRPGNRARMTMTRTETDKVDFWALEYQEVIKPITTWKQNDSVTANRPDLAKIKQWQELKATSPSDYALYHYDTAGSELAGNTLLLAKMIYPGGISSYTIHTPIVTRTSIYAQYPDDVGSDIDMQIQPASVTGWAAAGTAESGNVPTSLANLAQAWLKTSDSIAPNADGTFSRREQWLGADSFNVNLYPEPAS